MFKIYPVHSVKCYLTQLSSKQITLYQVCTRGTFTVEIDVQALYRVAQQFQVLDKFCIVPSASHLRWSEEHNAKSIWTDLGLIPQTWAVQVCEIPDAAKLDIKIVNFLSTSDTNERILRTIQTREVLNQLEVSRLGILLYFESYCYRFHF